MKWLKRQALEPKSGYNLASATYKLHDIGLIMQFLKLFSFPQLQIEITSIFQGGYVEEIIYICMYTPTYMYI